jgi:putative peptide zinc metalloprotease protein
MTLAPRRLAATALLACGALVATAAPATAGDDTVAIAVNTKDGFDIFKLAFQVRHVTGDTIDSGNAAVAYASCTDCQTVAIAIQVVLISGYDSSTVSPENLAIAINESCSLCDTLASAYQFVLTAEGNLHFTADGNRRLAALRQALRDLGRGDLPVEQIQAKLDTLMDELAAILSTELVPSGPVATKPTPTAVPSSAPATPGDDTEPSATAPASESPTAEPTTAPPPPSESASSVPASEPAASETP